MSKFQKIVYTPAGSIDATLAIAACRAGGIGVLNAEFCHDEAAVIEQLHRLARYGESPFGLKLDASSASLLASLIPYVERGLQWLVVDQALLASAGETLKTLRTAGIYLLGEFTAPAADPKQYEAILDGIVLKGHEAGGLVGENSSFILLQQWLGRQALPLYIHGGVTPQVAAAVAAVGVAGGVFDSQLLLFNESPLAGVLTNTIASLSGNETVAVGNKEQGRYFRLLVRPGFTAAQNFAQACAEESDQFAPRIIGQLNWHSPAKGLLPLGQDVAFAGPWREQYGHLAELFGAVDTAVKESMNLLREHTPLVENAPLARTLGTRLPIVQGPMTRVSDSADFAGAIADAGGLPMLAFALLKGQALEDLLLATQKRLGDQPWGIGLLGFAPQTLLDEQLARAKKFQPDYAIIAGGRPDQAVKLEKEGIQSFLHVPSSSLIPLFLQEGARRFIFEGRECGGHIGPLSSFVLWSAMVDQLLIDIDSNLVKGEEINILFAGGIHDAASSAMVQVLSAPLLAKGVQIGILMGSAYLFTREIVEFGAIVPQFQQEVIACEQTVSLESGPGHASRCAYTPFARAFFDKSREMRRNKIPLDESREVLDDLIMGRLRIASKGCARLGGKSGKGEKSELTQLDATTQRNDGMYMLGQVATLRAQITDIATLHDEVTLGAADLIESHASGDTDDRPAPEKPVNIAIIGMASLLPKANSTREYWENIIHKVNGITEIPAHRWDWRLYFDQDRHQEDKIYSKWGGFLDDLAFDPTHYGMPPKSVPFVDPMQLMALEIASRALEDAGYAERPFDRDKASVILGASGGAGDVGMQYGLRAELPRFKGDLPDDIAGRLPEWTEDTFAGILMNVVAGRIANRLNFGGVNFTTDAACASSLSAIYQGISELVAGRSHLVLAGGVDTVQGPFGYLCFSKTQALSPRGRCNTFDAAGDGIVISEGIAMIAIKRLADAERDGDRIYAVIKGAGGSSDGRAKGLAAPLPAGQLRAMRRAYRQAGFTPDTVGLFEAHGTGTVAGDTAELESTTRLVRESSELSRQAVVGSVKSMIGHTKATAGVAGLIKAALALHHQVLPPHLGVKQANPVLADEACPLYLLAEARPWLARPYPRRAACSAFGFGGTNFHIVMEEYHREYRPWLREKALRRFPSELLLWNSPDKAALLAAVQPLLAELEGNHEIELENLAYSLTQHFNHHSQAQNPLVLAIVATDGADLARKLTAAVASLQDQQAALSPGVYLSNQTGIADPAKVAVLFPGQGAQYPDMGRELACLFPEVADCLAQADQCLSQDLAQRFDADTQLNQFIFPRGAYSEEQRALALQSLTRTDIAQPAIGAVEAGFWQLLQGFGLTADMFAGHSYGEFAALYAAGVYDFADFIALSFARGRFIVDSATEAGTMAAVHAARHRVEALIADIDDLVVANHNAPALCIISGAEQSVRQAIERFNANQINAGPIPVSAAFHSPFVQPAREQLAEVIAAGQWQSPKTPVYSNASGERHSTDVEPLKQAMSGHLVQPVEFVRQIETMYQDGARLFIEVGPKSILTRSTTKILQGKTFQAVAMDDFGGGINGLLNTLALLLCSGRQLDLSPLYRGRHCRYADPASLANFFSQPVHGKQTWLLNGSGARRFGEPVKQIGVTLEQAQQETQPAPALLTPVSTPVATTAPVSNRQQPGEPKTPQQSISPISHKRKEKKMSRRSAPQVGATSVMAEYFETMRQFLESQENVMSLYLNGTPVVRDIGAEPPLHRTAPPASMPLAQPVAPAAPTTAAAPAEPVAAIAPAPIAETVVKPAPATVVPEPSPQPEPQPIAAPQKAVTSQPAAATTSVERDKMATLLLAIVEDKTGYPGDMVGLEQKLEADLGIDSIKRIEIVGALLKELPPAYGETLGEDRGELNTQATLNGMLDILDNLPLGGGGTTGPFDSAGMREAQGIATQPANLSFRHIIQPEQSPLPVGAAFKLNTGHFVIVPDVPDPAEVSLADGIKNKLEDQGADVSLLPLEILGSEEQLRQYCATLVQEQTHITGVIHLAEFGRCFEHHSPSGDAFKAELNRNEKSYFLLLQNLGHSLARDAHLVAVSSLGGLFGRTGTAPRSISLQGGCVGLLKSLAEERPELRVKAIDLDPGLARAALAEQVMTEITLLGGRQEVGYPKGQRTIFKTLAQAVGPDSVGEQPDNPVILATGGLKGITAEVLRGLAQPGCRLLLTGRSPLSAAETGEIAALRTEGELKQHFIERIRAGKTTLTPAEVQRKIRAIMDAREMRSNLEDFKQAGATVDYFAVDVTDEAGIKALLASIYDKYGTITGVVHGAGIIEDKLLDDKTGESWSRVVATKVVGLFNLQKYIRPEPLRFFAVFSSVAGRYGNSGQTDYATANELLNRLCLQLAIIWEHKVNVRSICWGPWGATRFGAGMVTEETEAKFAAKGVALVDARAGREFFVQEVWRRPDNDVEVVAGIGPWEQREAEIGRLLPSLDPGIGGQTLGALLEQAGTSAQPKGEQIVHFSITDNHRYLFEHSIDGIPVLPAAAALEMMAEAATVLWPGWQVVEARDYRLLKGLQLPALPQAVKVVINPPTYGDSGGFEVTAMLRTEDQGKTRFHYKVVLRLQQQFPDGFEWAAPGYKEQQLAVDQVYRDWLIHGPCYRVFDTAIAIAEGGAEAQVHSTRPAQWKHRAGEGEQWVFDPAITDVAAQMAWIWARAFKDKTALPARFGRVVRYQTVLPEQLVMYFECQPTEEADLIRANVYFVDESGRVALLIEGLESVASRELNRVGGVVEVGG